MSNVILEYLKTGVEPFPDANYGDGYRCSAYLNDGTFLPCVMLRRSELVAALALRRFEQERKGKRIFRSNGYEQIVKTFVASGNRVNHFDIAKVEPSRFAFPLALVKQIEGETTMAWTGFVLEMRDGKSLPFGTSFGVEFFDIPNTYTFEEVVGVHNHAYVSARGELRSLAQGMAAHPKEYDLSAVLREKPYFVCYYDV